MVFNTISFSLQCSKGVHSISEDEDGKSNNIKTFQRARCMLETAQTLHVHSLFIFTKSLEVGTIAVPVL